MWDLLRPIFLVFLVMVFHKIFYVVLPGRPFIRSFFVAWCTGLVANFFLIVRSGSNWLVWFGDIILITCLSYVYMDLLCIGEASIRVKILDEVEKSGPEGLTTEALLARYNARVVGIIRIRRLLESRCAVQTCSRIVLSGFPNWPLLRAIFVAAIKRFLFGKGA